MVSGDPLAEARSLFASLARVQALVRQGEDKQEPELFARALERLDACAFDLRWRDDIAAKCVASARDSQARIVPKSMQDAGAPPHVRIERARESGDPLMLGNMFVRHGLYRDALMAYNSSEHRLECVSNLNILQGNWSMVQANLGKSTGLDTLDNIPLLNLALAHWSVGHYGDALSVLLRLDPARDMASAWLSESQTLGMLLVSAVVALDRSTLKFFARADPVFLFMNRVMHSRLVEALLDVDFVLFWSEAARLDIPATSSDLDAGEQPRALLRDRIEKDWLFVHNKLALETVLDVFGAGRGSEYTCMDLLEDLRRWDAPYRIDTVRGTLELHERVTRNDELAEELARWFKRDSLVLCHHHHRSGGKKYYVPA